MVNILLELNKTTIELLNQSIKKRDLKIESLENENAKLKTDLISALTQVNELLKLKNKTV